MAWMLRLVKIGAEGEGPCTDIMEVHRPDDLSDIADLGLSLAEAKRLLARVQQVIVAGPGQGPRRSATGMPALWPHLPCEGLPGPCSRDAVRPGHGTASPLSLPRVWRDGGWPCLAIALPVDTGAGPVAGASLRPDDLPDGR